MINGYLTLSVGQAHLKSLYHGNEIEYAVEHTIGDAPLEKPTALGMSALDLRQRFKEGAKALRLDAPHVIVDLRKQPWNVNRDDWHKYTSWRPTEQAEQAEQNLKVGGQGLEQRANDVCAGVHTFCIDCDVSECQGIVPVPTEPKLMLLASGSLPT